MCGHNYPAGTILTRLSMFNSRAVLPSILSGSETSTQKLKQFVLIKTHVVINIRAWDSCIDILIRKLDENEKCIIRNGLDP